MNNSPPVLPNANPFGSSSSYVLDIKDTESSQKVILTYDEGYKVSHIMEWHNVQSSAVAAYEEDNSASIERSLSAGSTSYIVKHLWINVIGMVFSFLAFVSAVFLHSLPLSIILFVILFGFFEMFITIIIDKKELA